MSLSELPTRVLGYSVADSGPVRWSPFWKEILISGSCPVLTMTMRVVTTNRQTRINWIWGRISRQWADNSPRWATFCLVEIVRSVSAPSSQSYIGPLQSPPLWLERDLICSNIQISETLSLVCSDDSKKYQEENIPNNSNIQFIEHM